MTPEAFEAEVRAKLRAAGDGAYVSTNNSPRAHRIVARSAKAYCAELYEVYASRWNDFYAAFPSQNDFVRTFWPHFIGHARTTLAGMLATNISEDLKAAIHDGLIRDQSLASTRRHVPQVKMDI